VREYAPERRFVLNCRVTDETRAALAELEIPVAWFDRREEPADASTMNWAARHVFGERGERPVAVADDGAVGKEPMIRVVTETPAELVDVVRQLAPDAA
jgi:hydroxymethylpyrimidine/phosphomethylpyrimidine kinase